MVADQWWAPFSGLVNSLSAVGRVEEGWSNLNELPYTDEKGNSYGRLQQKDNGFEKILEIIRDKHPGIDESQITDIIHSGGMVYELGQGTVPVTTVISLLTQGESTPDAIATAETVRQRITEFRLRFVLHWGFRLLFLGFVLGLPRCVFEVVRKDVN